VIAFANQHLGTSSGCGEQWGNRGQLFREVASSLCCEGKVRQDAKRSGKKMRDAVEIRRSSCRQGRKIKILRGGKN